MQADHMEPVELTAQDLTLRPWQPSDAEAVSRACQDPEIQRWTNVPSPYLLEHATEWVSVLSPKGWADGTVVAFGVFDTATGSLLGSNALVSLDRRQGSAEVGYWTAPWARGRGVAARSTRLIARWAFESLGLRRLTWHAVLGNHPSRLTALRVGFQVDGRIRLADPPAGALPLAWVGSLLPGDLDAGPRRLDPVLVRRAKTFGTGPPKLETRTSAGPLTLRAPTERDVDAMTATCQGPEAVRWTSVPQPYRRADAQTRVRNCRRHWAEGDAAVFSLYDDSDSYCGSIDLRLSATDPAIADVGYMVSPWARGRGYATAALRRLCEWGFAELDLTRIEWRAQVGNHASRRVAEKAGFRVEGVERAGLAHRGERRDCWVGALLRTDLG